MSHIFISYSRRDLAFAQKIVDALAAQDLEMWIDWKSIPKGEDWEQEIYRGIETADALLFLISPDSVHSKMCNKEIIHALKSGKRILPILLHKTTTSEFLDETAKTEIERLNWVFIQKDTDDFDAAIDQIRNTIRTDYDWVRFHTTLLTRALDWERAGKDDSRLLRGKELTEAEGKLSKAGQTREPLLTDVQRQYIQKSRKATAAQRRLPFTVAAGLILLLLLTLMWFDKSWYRVWPIRQSCPALTRIFIDLNTNGLSPEVEQNLKKGIANIPSQTTLRYCNQTQLTDNATLRIIASDQDSAEGFKLEILFPHNAAYHLDFLPEIRQLGPETVSLNEALVLLRAASEYSLGNYEGTASILGEASEETSLSALILLAQSYLFLDYLDESRASYELAIQKSGGLGASTDRLNMGAALAYWRPILYNNSYPEKEKVCDQAKTHYENVEPQTVSASYINNAKLVFADRYHCVDSDWKQIDVQIDPQDVEATAIGNFVRAIRCTTENVEAGCNYLAELTSAEKYVLFARARLVRQYYLRETGNKCAGAEPFLASFQKEALNPQDIRELRDLLRIKAMNC